MILAAILLSFCVASLVEAAAPMGSEACAGASCEVQIACRPEVPPAPSGSWNVPLAALRAGLDDLVRPDCLLGVSITASASSPPGCSACSFASRAPPAGP